LIIPAEFAIDASGLARRFGSRWVLRGVTFSLPPGEIVGLQGANGSGKTTLLRILATLLKPSAGSARVAGHDIVGDPDAVREHVAFMGHVPGLYGTGEVLYLSGNRIASIMAGVQAFTDPNLARTLVAKMKAGRNGVPRYYQIIVKVRAMDEMPVEISYVLHRELPAK